MSHLKNKHFIEIKLQLIILHPKYFHIPFKTTALFIATLIHCTVRVKYTSRYIHYRASLINGANEDIYVPYIVCVCTVCQISAQSIV